MIQIFFVVLTVIFPERHQSIKTENKYRLKTIHIIQEVNYLINPEIARIFVGMDFLGKTN
jgi:hypothetical protein